MKKAIALLLVLVMVFALCACGGGDKGTADNGEKVVKIGVSGHIAFDETGDAIRDTAYIKTIDSAANAWKFVTQQKAS